LFKAVAAVAPITDLGLLKDDFRHYTNYRFAQDFIGGGPHVAEGSPLRQAAKISAPVFLAHADMDQNVAVRHSRAMADGLRDAGKSVELLEFKGLGHSLNDSTARTELLVKIGQLLDRTIGR
jgi:dipeptidyl aminopeptidase/acylaminoacyl peptidase